MIKAFKSRSKDFKKNRIQDLHIPIQDAIITMCEGNPGAIMVCVELMSNGKSSNDDSIANGLMDICRLDDQRVYGSNIWLAYKDICEQDIVKLRDLIRDYKVQEELEKLPYYHKS